LLRLVKALTIKYRLLTQCPIDGISRRAHVHRNVPDELATVQFSASQAGNEKMGYSLVCGQNDLVFGAIPGGMNGR
jgi:hypothetical protein